MVSVVVDGVAYCTARVSARGRWTCAGTAALLPGRHAVRARQKAAGRSVSRYTTAVAITVR